MTTENDEKEEFETDHLDLYAPMTAYLQKLDAAYACNADDIEELTILKDTTTRSPEEEE